MYHHYYLLHFNVNLGNYDDDEEDGYLRHNKVSILKRGKDNSNDGNSNQIVSLKSSYRGDNQFYKRRNCLEPYGEHSYRNYQSNNNSKQR